MTKFTRCVRQARYAYEVAKVFIDLAFDLLELFH